MYSFLYFSADTPVDGGWIDQYPATINASGWVKWKIVGQFKTKCETDMTLFPFDMPSCNIDVGAIGTPSSRVFVGPGNSSATLQVPEITEEFNVINVSFQSYNESSCLSAMRYTITLKRLPTYYILNFIAPCSMLISVSLLAFVLPVTSGERISLQITVILSSSIYQLIVTSQVPVTSRNIPLMSKLNSRALCNMVLSG